MTLRKKKILIEEALNSVSQIIDVCQRLAKESRPKGISILRTDVEIVYYHSKNAERKLKTYERIPRAPKKFLGAMLGALHYGLKLFEEYKFLESEAKFRQLKAYLDKLLGTIERGTDLL